jgi:hypothetical protein
MIWKEVQVQKANPNTYTVVSGPGFCQRMILFKNLNMRFPNSVVVIEIHQLWINGILQFRKEDEQIIFFPHRHFKYVRD